MRYWNTIIEYFFHHDVPVDIRQRVFTYIMQHWDDENQDAVLRKLWEEAGHDHSDSLEVKEALAATERQLGIERSSVGRRVPMKKRTRWYLYAASLLLPLFALAFSAYWYRESKNNLETVAQMEMLQVSTDYGQRKTVILPDSSKVWLNSGSMIVYPSAFVAKERKVFLSGEAFFQVTKHKRPFVVSTNYLEMKVLGTTFDVRNYLGDQSMTVTLKTGSLRVALLGGENVHKPFILSPNQQLVYVPSTGEACVQTLRKEDGVSWMMNELQLKDITLTDVMLEIERMYNVRCHLLNSRYAHQRIRAHFNQNEKLQRILEVIKELVPGIDYRIEGKDIYFK